MAYFSFNETYRPGEYDQINSLNNNYYFVPQDYEPSIYNLFDYDPTPFLHYTNNSPNTTTTAYSTFTPTQPKTVIHRYHHSHQIVSAATATTGFYDQTQAPAAEKASPDSFNAPGFEEYDTTPYGGGYDIAQTYGVPLPPSDQICYPRNHQPQASESDPAPPPQKPEKNKKKKSVRFAVDENGRPEEPKPEPKKIEVAEESNEVVREPENLGPPLFPAEEAGVSSQIPSGYGLEAMDLYGSLFGYLPCTARYYAGIGNGCLVRSPESCAASDYLFGGADPYVERRDGGGSFGQPIHCYDRHYPAQPLTVQHYPDDDDDDRNRDHCSWPQSFGIF